MRWLLGFVLLLLALGTLRTVGCGDESPCGDCSDGNPCTRGSCGSYDPTPGGPITCDPDDIAYRCYHTPQPDGTPCGGGNVCVNGACSENLCADCEDDRNSCTIDCDYETGVCDYVRLPDGDLCKGEQNYGGCYGGVCIVCEELDCDDGDLCTTDDCHPHYGGCINNPANCRDWDDCTENNCNPLDGVCDFTTPAEDGTSCIGDFDGLARIGMCRAGVCVPPCDPESEEILQCPRKRGEDQFCCPGCELCNRSCEDIFRCLVSDGEGGSGGTGGTGGTGGVGGAGGAGGSAGWTCPDENYGAADGCHCGCGVIDPDCADGTVASCDTCDGPGSCSGGLGCPGDIDHAQNWICGG